MDVISVVVEAMRKQTGSKFLAARHNSKQHRPPLKEVKSPPFYKRRGCASKWQVCGKMCIAFPHPFVAASSSRHPPSSAGGASQFSPGREAGYPTPPNPYRHSDRSDPAFSSARFLGAGARREDRRPIPRFLRDESLRLLCSGEFILPSALKRRRCVTI